MPLIQLTSLNEMPGIMLSQASVVIVPVAATEAHGPHLPHTTDCDIASGHLSALEGYLDSARHAVVLPVERIGASQEHCRFAEISLDPALLVARWFAIAQTVNRAGGKRIVFVSSHGGNSAAVDTVILKVRAELGMLAVGTAWLRFGFPAGLYPDDEKQFGIHGGAIETALMLHYRPDLVAMDRAENFQSRLAALEPQMTHLRAYGPHRFGWLSADLHASGVVGDARLASAEKGAVHADHILKGFAALLDDVAEFDIGWLA